MLMFPWADVTAADSSARPTSYKLRMDAGASRTEVAAALSTRLGGQARVEAVSRADPAELDPFRFAVDTGASNVARADAKLVSALKLPIQGATGNSDGMRTATAATVITSRRQHWMPAPSACTRNVTSRLSPAASFLMGA